MKLSKYEVSSFLVLVGLVSALLLAGGCGAPATPPPEPVEPTVVVEETVVVEATPSPVATPAPSGGPKLGGTLHFGIRVEWMDFDPHNLGWAQYPCYDQLYDTLIKYDSELNPHPMLAESWEVSEDGLTWTLHLRQGVKFHNGRELVADDVVKNFEKARNPDTGFHQYTMTASVEKVEALDDYTVVVTFSQVYTAAMDLFEGFSIIAPEAFEAVKDHPIGTGPFMFVDWIPNDHATFAKFEDYWGEGPYVDEIVWHPNPDTDALVAALESAAYDVVWDLPYKDVPRLRAGGFPVLEGQPGAFIWQIYVNPNNLQDRRIRQAMQYALDRETIVEKVFYGLGGTAWTPFPDYSLAYDPDFENYYTFDLDKAKALLEEAGALDTQFVIAANDMDQARVAQILQSDLRKIGVQATVELMDYTQFFDQLMGAKYEHLFVIFISNGNKDPARLLLNSHYRVTASPISCGDNPYCPEEYYELSAKAASMLDPEARKEIYHRIQEILLEESWAISFAEKPVVVATQPDVQGMDFRVDSAPRLGMVWLDR